MYREEVYEMKKLVKVHNRKNTVKAFKTCGCLCICHCNDSSSSARVSRVGSVAGGAITSSN